MKHDRSFRDRYLAATALVRAGDLPGAKEALQSLHGTYPDDAATTLMLGNVLWEMNALDEAVGPLREAVAMRPKSEISSLALFHVLWGLDKRRDAVQEMGRFMALCDSEDYREMFTEDQIREAVESGGGPD